MSFRKDFLQAALNPADRLEYAARRNASRKLGWFFHASIYVIVNMGLGALALSHGRHWNIYTALFWGIGLLAHGLSVWVLSPHGALWQRMVEREREALQRSNHPSQS